MPTPTLPTRFRPLWARRVILPMEAIAVLTFGFGFVALPREGPEPWGVFDLTGLVVIAAAIVAFLHRLAAVRVEADEQGITVVNILRRRRLDWAEILGVRLPPAEPWLILDLSDGTALPAMGVQGSDGAYARAQAMDLARLVAAKTRTERND
ncbi:MAG: PH domain-containing protein [Actinomycetota bacterium]|nr:PH domain-containing protein [Actinomycetota bacterium]